LQNLESANNDQTKWIRWLSELTEVRSMLFARGVVLVEGGTEQGALLAWFAKSSVAKGRGTIEDLNISVFGVGGDQQFQTFISLLAALRIPWAIVCDGNVFLHRPKKSGRIKSIFQQLLGAGIKMEKSSLENADDFERAKKVGAAHGVFTLLEDFSHEFEEYVNRKFPKEFEAAKKEWPESKVLAGRALAQQTSCPREVEELYGQILDRFAVPSASARNG